MADLTQPMTDERIRAMHSERQQPFVFALRDSLAAHSPIVLLRVGFELTKDTARWRACVGYPSARLEAICTDVAHGARVFLPETGRAFALTIIAHALAAGEVSVQSVGNVEHLRCDRIGCWNLSTRRVLGGARTLCNACREQLLNERARWPTAMTERDIEGAIVRFFDTLVDTSDRLPLLRGDEIEKAFRRMTEGDTP